MQRPNKSEVVLTDFLYPLTDHGKADKKEMLLTPKIKKQSDDIQTKVHTAKRLRSNHSPRRMEKPKTIKTVHHRAATTSVAFDTKKRNNLLWKLNIDYKDKADQEGRIMPISPFFQPAIILLEDQPLEIQFKHSHR